MARPFLFRLFGPNAPTTLADFRAAVLNAPFGEGIGDGHLFSSLRAILNLPPRVERPAQRGPDGAGPGADPSSIAAAMVAGQELAANGAVGNEPSAIMNPGIAGNGSERSESVHLNGIASHGMAGGPVPLFSRLDLSAPYALIGDFQTGLVIDTRTKSLMPGGPSDYPQLGAGKNDTIELDGDYSAGFAFSTPDCIEQIIVRAGNDYNLIAEDASVGAGQTLVVNAMPLGDSNRMIFDGTDETDGRFIFYGSESGDVFLGGAGNDLIWGMGGGDVLSGGGGSDTFAYHDAAQSSGADYDVLADFNAASDRIDLDVTVSGFDAAVQAGSLSTGSFDADLGAALAGLGAGRAAYYAPDSGDLAGTVFLVVDANGVAGYQAGEDYVFALAGATLADLNGQTGFFI